MKVKEEFFGFSPVMWMGVVEDNEDPIKLGRVRVRIFGWHNGSPKETDEEPGVKTNELPWAQVMQPVNNGPNSGFGGPVTGILKGTWVMGMFLDGQIAREPLVMGSIPGIPMNTNPNPIDKEAHTNGGPPEEGFYDPTGEYPKSRKDWGNEEPDTSRLTRNDSDYAHTIIRKKYLRQHESKFANGFEIKEPVFKEWQEFKSKYPNNKAMETPSGHVFEIDDTPEFERIHVYHKNGSYIEMGGAVGPGNRIDKVTGDWYTMIDRNHYNSIGGDFHTAGRHISTLGQTFSVMGKSISLKASGAIILEGKVYAKSLSVRTGATGNFVDMNGKAVKVKDGIIVALPEGG
jgi:hypothetical protein